MHNFYKPYPYPYWVNMPMYNPYNMYPYQMWGNSPMNNQFYSNNHTYDKYHVDSPNLKLKDYGPNPFVINIDEATKQNNTFRTALWTGEDLQVTLMKIDVGDDIGLEVHPVGDQFIRIEKGQGIVQIGDTKDNLTFQKRFYDDYAIMIPAGKWHNVINTGNTPLKLYAIYAPPEHHRDTVHQTKEDAEADEHGY